MKWATPLNSRNCYLFFRVWSIPCIGASLGASAVRSTLHFILGCNFQSSYFSHWFSCVPPVEKARWSAIQRLLGWLQLREWAHHYLLPGRWDWSTCCVHPHCSLWWLILMFIFQTESDEGLWGLVSVERKHVTQYYLKGTLPFSYFWKLPML